MIRLQYILIILCAVLASCSGSKKMTEGKVQKLNFENTDLLSEAISIAETRDLPVFIDFYTSWCLPCRIMDEEVFSQKEVLTYFNDNFVNLKVNAEEGNGPNLRFIMGVQGYPTLIFVDHKGNELKRHQGSLSQKGMMEMAREAKGLFDSRKDEL